MKDVVTPPPKRSQGRPRMVLAEACPVRPAPRDPEVHATILKWAERDYLQRKEIELRFTNQHYEIMREQRARANLGELEPSVVQYEHIQAYRRMELSKRGQAAFDRLWPLARSHYFVHLVLNVKSSRCRLHHAQRLQGVRLYMWRRLSKLVTGYVRSLHVDKQKYPHWDYVLAVPRDRQGEFDYALRQLNREIYGAGGPEDVRIWSKPILPIRRHLERTIDYCLRVRRFDPDPTHPWFAESFRSDACGLRLGITRRRIVRCREYTPSEPSLETVRAPGKPGRPRKSDGKAYRQRRRRHSEPSRDAGSYAPD
ncbi:hypothetical protein [Bosea sp. ANAM02]|uniref:hypothetical protein n=1 Tax=Bosea sp. ANAM02 TaxID=2020412 RepID=UPI00140F3A0E|nr:hypothetical protein [Bosea sp. ANAM02]BCB18652.1 hypothetical protein OCUBac02_15460 [Bosea sp. ANAM02]